MLCFSSAPRYIIQVTESLIFKNSDIIRFCAKLRVHKRFRFKFILLQYDLFYTVQAVSKSNWTEWSTIQGVIGRVISKSDEREARGRFEITSPITP